MSKFNNLTYLLIILLKINIFVIFIKIRFILISNIKKNKATKVCICTLGKEENRYIREFVIYYKNLGVDKIFLYDNNDKENEHFEEVIKDFIDNGFVEIFDWRGIEKPHLKVINDCYIKNNIYYDWLMFYDIDEYIHIPSNIKDFLNEKKFDKCKKIYLNWVFHTDNNLIYYDNRSLWERFPDIERDAIINKNYSQRVKSILRGNISDFKIANNSFGSHIITNSVNACDGYGNEINLTYQYYMENSDAKNYYIDHFFTKSLEEFVNKIKKGSAVNGKDSHFALFRLIRYFHINQFKDIKFYYLKKKFGINIVFNENNKVNKRKKRNKK